MRVNRTDLQLLADARIADGEVLLAAGRYQGAYYLMGYALECALKASVAKQIKEHDFPDKKLINDSYTHDLDQLLAISGLKPQLGTRAAADAEFDVNWTTVKDWNESSRYDGTITERKARDLYIAATDQAHGILPWLKTLW